MTDPLITEYLPVLRGHVIKKYRWMEERGNCLITLDDLIQIASIRLMSLVDKWDDILAEQGKTREGNGGMFWKFLAHQVKQDVLKYYNRDGRPESNDSLDIETDTNAENPAEIKTSLLQRNDGIHWRAIHNDIVDFFATLPRKDKTFLALRYFDEMQHSTAAALLGIGEKSYRNQVGTITARWRDYTRNQFTDVPVDVARRIAVDWEPTEALITYLRDRHRKDLSEYLGIVTIAFREDTSYLVDALNTQKVVVPGATPTLLSPAQQQQVDELMGQGVNKMDISRKLGVTYGAVIGHAKRRHAVIDPR